MRQQIEEARQRREQRLSEIAGRFWAAHANASDAAGKAFRDAIQLAGDCIRERERSELLQDRTLVELQLYRPLRGQREAAPMLADHCYVTAASVAWWCVAKVIRESAHIPLTSGGYMQETWVNDGTTLCGRKAHYASHDEDDSGSWPRQHEVCPQCWAKLAAMGLVERPASAKDAPAQSWSPKPAMLF